MDNEEFKVEDLDIRIPCPKCRHEMIQDQNTLPLAESPQGAMLECGQCGEISQWEFSGEPVEARQVPVTWGGTC